MFAFLRVGRWNVQSQRHVEGNLLHVKAVQNIQGISVISISKANQCRLHFKLLSDLFESGTMQNVFRCNFIFLCVHKFMALHLM
jgi:hypothetical protein